MTERLETTFTTKANHFWMNKKYSRLWKKRVGVHNLKKIEFDYIECLYFRDRESRPSLAAGVFRYKMDITHDNKNLK